MTRIGTRLKQAETQPESRRLETNTLETNTLETNTLDIGKIETQRLDLWLYRARFFKTRALATQMIKTGKVRVTQNGRTFRATKPNTNFKTGDQLAFMQGTRLIHVQMKFSAPRRGPAPEAQALYKVLTPTNIS